MGLHLNGKRRGSWFKRCGALVLTTAFIALFFLGSAYGQTAKQRTFASPGEAVNAMIEALKSNDVKAMEEILGPGSEDLISSGDPVADQSLRNSLSSSMKRKTGWSKVRTRRFFPLETTIGHAQSPS